MNNLRLLLFLVGMTLFSCTSKVDNKPIKLTNEEVYDLMNNHVIKLFTTEEEPRILWCVKSVHGPNMESAFYHKGYPAIAPHYHFSGMDWNANKMEGVEMISWEDYQYYFYPPDSVDRDEEWYENYQERYVHVVAFPKVITNADTVMVRHSMTRPSLFCGTGLTHKLVFVKTEEGWKKFDHYKGLLR